MKERVEKCPKCGTERDSERWPFTITYKQWEQTAERARKIAHLEVECGRCAHFWRELPADAEANELKEMVEAAS